MSEYPVFFSRELSWIEFNARVLNEACRKDIPVIERLKFLAIVSSNFDEFFMVRVASLKHKEKTHPESVDIAGMTPAKQLLQISERVHQVTNLQYNVLTQQVIPELATVGIEYVAPENYTQQQKGFAKALFLNEIFPLLTPLRTDGNEFPHIASLRLYAAFKLKTLPDIDVTQKIFASDSETEPVAIVQVPAGLSRIVVLPSESGKKSFALLDDIIREYGTMLFPGYSVTETMLFKVTRDADIAVDEESGSDFIHAMEVILEKRQSSLAVRLLCTDSSPQILELLMEKQQLSSQDVYQVSGIIDPTTLLPLAEWPESLPWRYAKWEHFFPESISKDEPLWNQLKQNDLLLHTPYQSYEPVVSFLNDAVDDPNTLAIKMTLYRTSGNSPIIKALERAARNGKQVTAFVELKARFDEKQNISWATQLEKAGVIVVHGIVNLKVHAKILLVVRKEEDAIRRYVHLATGNYNDKTARSYSDMSIFTTNEEIANDATVFFNIISGYSVIQPMRHLIMAPVNLKSKLIEMIDRETNRAKAGEPSHIMAKMNSLGDGDIIQALYRASNAGVKIQLNVRGVCMLVPGVVGQSQNIVVTSIIDRYLEHTRIVYFYNGGSQELFLSSADWMPRNLERRVELMFPVQQENLFKKIKKVLQLYFMDNKHSYKLNSDGSWLANSPQKGEDPVSAQETLYFEHKKLDSAGNKDAPLEFIVRRKN
ncbi:MAG: polyphosphate kinase 1 [Spirochaetaceae bacterium]|nr:polyphosphate kinase 1 [Spirochaetaceae bacterium]